MGISDDYNCMGISSDTQETWSWLQKGNLKWKTEYLRIAPPKNTIMTNHIEAKIGNTRHDIKYRLYGDRDGTIDLMISECIKLV